ncbi:MAG TPA: serine/threonine-protein kinase [Pyrinomonadaceae bacterium]|nr:serine/threonine-protein kinase [Pyrinomonadaceae bacterium]
MTRLERFIGEVLDGKYRLERLLGQGGMGAVYLATHLGTERPVALKLITPEFMRNDEFVERFKREARAAGRLRHPNVVDVTDFGFAQVGSQRVAYLVMEYLDGCTLGDVLAEESRLPLDWVVDILEQTCSAVDEAHQQGVVHRDLKPDNIWLEPNRFGGYRVKVLDFGIAKLADAAVNTGELPAPPNELAAASASQASAQTEAQSALDAVQASIARAASSVGGRSDSHAPHGDGASEAATQLNTLNAADSEQGTLLLPSQPSTRVAAQQPNDPTAVEVSPRSTQADADGDKTRMLDPTTAGRKTDLGMQTASTAGVTRVGAILGTPLYMSPEQCRGERLDARSDIYSLGVIAYQMLAGETPFKGDMVTVMRQHMEAAPPPVREKNKKVSKKVARLLMSSLAKNPIQRPASAAAFASALRGNSEGIGSLLRRGFALYSEYFPKFLRISLLAHIPVIVVMFLLLGFDVLKDRNALSPAVEIVLTVVLGLLQFVVSFLATSVITAMTVLIVTQLHVAPMRPISLRDAFAVLKRRWRPFLRTSIRVSLTVMLCFAVGVVPGIVLAVWHSLYAPVALMLGVIPGIVMLVRYALYAPVVLMEGMEKRAALKRANELSRRSRRTVIALLLIQFLLPMLMGAVVGFLTVKFKGPDMHVASQASSRLAPLFNIITVPLISITTALLYLKMRQIGGETFKETLEQFENVEAPRTNWQQRMRRRLTVNTPVSRG